MAEGVYLTTRQVAKRYNRSNTVWVYRRVKGDPNFPRPIYIGGQKYFRLADLEAYDADSARQIAPVIAFAPDRKEAA